MDMELFHKDQKLDPNHLDLAAATQGETFFHWAQQSIHAKKRVDRAKLNVELVENQLALAIRKDPEYYHLVKVTEGAIIATVKSHERYQTAVAQLIDAREEAGLLDVAVVSMEQRKRMIEVLITLHGQQYFAGPAVPHNLGVAWLEYQEVRKVELGDRQKTKIRKRRNTNEEKE